MAQFQISTPDEPTMFAAAQILGLIPVGQTFAAGAVGMLTGGVNALGAWAANIYGVDPNAAGFFGILVLPDNYALPGDMQTLASRVFQIDPTTGAVTVTAFSYGAVTITAIPSDSPVVFS